MGQHATLAASTVSAPTPTLTPADAVAPANVSAAAAADPNFSVVTMLLTGSHQQPQGVACLPAENKVIKTGAAASRMCNTPLCNKLIWHIGGPCRRDEPLGDRRIKEGTASAAFPRVTLRLAARPSLPLPPHLRPQQSQEPQRLVQDQHNAKAQERAVAGDTAAAMVLMLLQATAPGDEKDAEGESEAETEAEVEVAGDADDDEAVADSAPTAGSFSATGPSDPSVQEPIETLAAKALQINGSLKRQSGDVDADKAPALGCMLDSILE